MTLNYKSSAFALALCASCGIRARAQNVPLPQTPPAPILAANKTEFETTLAALSQKYQTAIVAESAPLHPTLSPNATSALQAALASPIANKKADLAAAASAFDYEPVFVNEQTVLLLKKYSDGQDLPDVLPGEAALFLDALLKETAPFLPPKEMNETNLILDLFANASPSEITAYANGVQWKQLPPAFQRNFVSLQTGDTLVKAIPPLEKLLTRLKGIAQTENVVFKTMEYENVPCTVYQSTASSGSHFAAVALSDYGRLRDDNFFGPLSFTKAKPTTSPPAQEGLKNASSSGPLSCQKTLAQIAQEINTLPNQSGGVRADIATAFQQKNVCLFGTERLSPLAKIKAVAQVFGLRGIQGSDKILHVVPPSPRPLKDASEIASEVSRLMPAPLLRALYVPLPVHPPGIPAYVGIGQVRTQQEAKMSVLYSEAITRLRRITEPKIAAASDHQVVLASLPVEAQTLLALSSLISNPDALQRLEGKNQFLTPDDFTRATFTASHSGSRYTYEIRVTPPKGEPGGKSTKTSFGGAPDPPE